MPVFKISFSAMACACEVVLEAPTEALAHPLARTAIDEVKRIEEKFSRYVSNSVISHINRHAGERPVHCDAETWALLDYADTLYRQSAHRFDITSGVLRKAWNFKSPALPDRALLSELLPLVNWSLIERDGQSVFLPRQGMEVDFGGFAKEYAADRAATLLAQLGAQSGYVNLGGDMRFMGPRSDQRPWLIGLQDPRRHDAIMATVPLSIGALATSGDYERFFELDGLRYCHLLNPHTGFPVSYWRSVSVMAPLATVAGSCSTTAMLLESEGLAFLKATGFDFFAVDQAGSVHTQPLKTFAERPTG